MIDESWDQYVQDPEILKVLTRHEDPVVRALARALASKSSEPTILGDGGTLTVSASGDGLLIVAAGQYVEDYQYIDEDGQRKGNLRWTTRIAAPRIAELWNYLNKTYGSPPVAEVLVNQSYDGQRTMTLVSGSPQELPPGKHRLYTAPHE